MSQKKIIVGNWKMHPSTATEALGLIESDELQAVKYKKVQVVVCPPTLYTFAVGAKKKKAFLGAQDLFSEEKGSYTGQISAVMLKNAGVTHVIIGHSERRKTGDTDETINKKVLLALKAGLTPIICVGEETRDDEGHHLGVIRAQIENALKSVKKTQLDSIVIAYEPVWAVGATEAMNAHDVHQMVIFVKKVLLETFKMKQIPSTPIIYGGSVDPINAGHILTEGEADGLLIGRQSLEPVAFAEIIALAQNA